MATKIQNNMMRDNPHLWGFFVVMMLGVWGILAFMLKYQVDVAKICN